MESNKENKMATTDNASNTTASNNKTETTHANASNTNAHANVSNNGTDTDPPTTILACPTGHPAPNQTFQFPPRSPSPPHQTAAQKLQESNLRALTTIATNASYLGYVPQQTPNIKATTHPDMAGKPVTFAFHTKGSQSVDRIVGLTKLLEAEVKELLGRLDEEQDKGVREGVLEKVLREVVPRLGGLNRTFAVEVGRVLEREGGEVKF